MSWATNGVAGIPQEISCLEERKNAMKIVRLLLLEKEDVRERLVQLGANVPEGLKAEQLANLYSNGWRRCPPTWIWWGCTSGATG